MGKKDIKRADKARKQGQADARQRVVLQVFHDADVAVEQVLNRLREAGKVPSCQRGCTHCCHLEIHASRAEAETIVAWLREQRSPTELDRLRDRLRGWLAWARTDLPRLEAAGMPTGEAFLKHSPGCPMLEDGACSIYPVRPMPCRNHYVTSPPEACGPAADATSTVKALPGVAQATGPIASAIRRVVEDQGGNFEATLHLLPEWVAHLLEVEANPWHR
ncbi:MAG: YkgJ family cysteine cluster protein [Kofleriaceae bacterium]